MKPGELHPGGFAAVPLQLQLDREATDTDLLVYGAIASAIDFDRGEGPIRLVRIQERARREARAIRRSLAFLEGKQYLHLDRRPGRPTCYRLLPTGEPTTAMGRGGSGQGTPDHGGTAGTHRRGRDSSETLPETLSERLESPRTKRLKAAARQAERAERSEP